MAFSQRFFLNVSKWQPFWNPRWRPLRWHENLATLVFAFLDVFTFIPESCKDCTQNSIWIREPDRLVISLWKNSGRKATVSLHSDFWSVFQCGDYCLIAYGKLSRMYSIHCMSGVFFQPGTSAETFPRRLHIRLKFAPTTFLFACTGTLPHPSNPLNPPKVRRLEWPVPIMHLSWRAAVIFKSRRFQHAPPAFVVPVDFWQQKTRVSGLSCRRCGIVCVDPSLAFWHNTQTNRRTHRRMQAYS